MNCSVRLLQILQEFSALESQVALCYARVIELKLVTIVLFVAAYPSPIILLECEARSPAWGAGNRVAEYGAVLPGGRQA